MNSTVEMAQPLTPYEHPMRRLNVRTPQGLRYHYFSGGRSAARPQMAPRLLVAVHGITRNAAEHLSALEQVAQDLSLDLVTPVFDDAQFPKYQLPARSARGRSAGRAFDQMLDHIDWTFGADTRQVILFGFSGGAQFAHRYAMMNPHRVRGLAIVAPGWLTFPDADVPYPYGTARRNRRSPSHDVAGVAGLPILAMVGALDKIRDPALRQNARVDSQQGDNRVERLERWVAAMTQTAETVGSPLRPELAVLPDSDHNFSRCVQNGGLTRRLGQWLSRQAL